MLIDVNRKTISIMKAAELCGVNRRTIYNWLETGKVDYIRTAGGSVRIYVDTLFYEPAPREPAPPDDALPPPQERTPEGDFIYRE